MVTLHKGHFWDTVGPLIKWDTPTEEIQGPKCPLFYRANAEDSLPVMDKMGFHSTLLIHTSEG